MRVFVSLLIACATLPLLQACGDPMPPVASHDVNWYKEHATERREVIARCLNDPGTMAATPDCVNASKAQSAVTWGSRKGIQVKPIQPEPAERR